MLYEPLRAASCQRREVHSGCLITVAGEVVVPGPGPETAFQKFCGAEYERVFEIARRMIRESTRITAAECEALARRIAAAHSDALYERLTGERPGGGGAAASRGERGMWGAERSRALEMHRSVSGARMGV
jgi:hypothetical protein